MNWTQVDIYTSTEGVEPLTYELYSVGIKEIAIKDSADFNDFLENRCDSWDYIEEELLTLSTCETCISAYLPDNLQGAEMLSLIKEVVERLKKRDVKKSFGRLDIKCKGIREEDWENNWKQYFKPFNIGKKILIKPSWESCENLEGRTIIEIDPASSFGTGQHHTTRLCLELLEENISGGEKILDLGCGSGILSIGGILLGAESACAVDISQNAAETAAENARANNISSEKYITFCGDIISDEGLREKIGGGYKIILANIVADVLIEMAPFFKELNSEDGILLVSGIIIQRMDEVISAISAQGYRRIRIKEESDWAAIEFHI